MPSKIVPFFPTFQDVDGDPLESGYIYIGTVGLNPEASPISIYWDEALTIPAAQPIRTIGGYASRSGTPAAIYVAESQYSVTVRNKNGTLVASTLTDTNLTTAITNDLASTAVGKGAALIGFKQNSIDAVDRTALAKLRDIVNVKDFGAIGDGTTDDGAAFQYAINYCSQNSLALVIPAGTYRINRRLTMSLGSITLIGEGRDVSLLVFDNVAAASSGISLTLDPYVVGPPNTWGSCTLKDFGIVANGVLVEPAISVAYTGIAFDGNRKIFIENVAVRPKTFGVHKFSMGLYVEKAVGVGIYKFDYVGDNAYSSNAIHMKECFDVTIHDPNIDYASDAIYATDSITAQFEGLQIVGGTLNNVTRGIVGVKTGATSCVFVSAIGTHIAAISSAVDLSDIDQWFFDDCLLYMSGAGTVGGSTVKISSGSDTGSLKNCVLSNNAGAANVTGILFVGTSTNITVGNNIVAAYNTGINRGALVNYTFTDNTFYLCTTDLTGTVAGYERLIDRATSAHILPAQPAFMAYLTASTTNDKTGDATVYTLTGFTEVYDQGGNFNGMTFTAPVTGKYQINVGVTLTNIGAAHTKAVLYLVTSNRTYIYVINAAAAFVAGDTTLTLPLSVVADMDAADTAQLQVSVHNSTKTIGIFGGGTVATHFSAALIC